MSTRDNILNKLNQSGKVKRGITLPEIVDETIYADFPAEAESDLLTVFKDNLEHVNGKCIKVTNHDEASRIILEVFSSVKAHRPIICQTPIIQKIVNGNADLSQLINGIECLNPSENSENYVDCNIGLSSAEWLIARTGSIICQTSSLVSRRSLGFPTNLVVVSTISNLLPSLADAFPRISNGNSQSLFTIMTGPSRTADIEKQLVLGAHGPKTLTVIII